MLSHTAEHALRAVLYIATSEDRRARVSSIAVAVQAPRSYLAKILSQLAAAGILESTRGPGGGFRLAMEPEELALSRISAVFNTGEPRRCLLGRGICGAVPDCPVHGRWAPVAGVIDAFFAHTTVSDLLHIPRTLS